MVYLKLYRVLLWKMGYGKYFRVQVGMENARQKESLVMLPLSQQH
jgi:hypothetical protein